MIQETPQSVELTPADRERMQCLSEEVQSRIQEMAVITARTMGMKLDDSTIVKFVPLAQAQFLDASPIEIVCSQSTGICGCYDPVAGTCGPCPVTTIP